MILFISWYFCKKINYYFDLIKHQGLKIRKFNFCVQKQCK